MKAHGLAVLVAWSAACERPTEAIDFTVTASGSPATSNIAAADYVGPDVCGECHGERHREWRGNLHRAMNQLAGDEAIVADFSGVAIDYAGASIRFGTDASGTRVIDVRGNHRRRFRVTRTIGRRYIQEVVGIQTLGPEPPGDPIYATELRLPYGYWLREKRWFHQQYFDSWFGPEYDERDRPTIDPSDVDRTPWATRCPWCHNTYPFEWRIGRAQGANGRGHGPETRFTLASAVARPENRLPLEALVTVGISCESCHFGGREHAAGGPIAFAPRGVGLTAVKSTPPLAGTRDDPTTINAICAQCHSAPSPRWPSGAAKRNSREALDLAAGACASAIKCTDCHDPHRLGEAAGAADNPIHVAACARCHPQIAAAPARHSRHQAASASCLDCHMPRIVQGFSGVIRSHRIGSPTLERIVAGREPDACGLCHLDKSPRALAVALADGWGATRETRDEPAIDLEAPIVDSWLAATDGTLRITAGNALARTAVFDRPGRVRRLLPLLDEPVAYLRMRGYFAVREVLGSLDYDPTAAPAQRRQKRRRLQSRLR